MKPQSIFALLIATAFGAGLVPKIPGTMGSLVAIPVIYWTMELPLEQRLLFWTLLTVLGIWAAKVFDESMGSSDNQQIVIDEVIGMGITSWTSGREIHLLFLSFFLFRLFDIFKPFPVRQIDRWSKKKAADKSSSAAAWWGGFGVVADDMMAGVQALLVVVLLQYFHMI